MTGRKVWGVGSREHVELYSTKEVAEKRLHELQASTNRLGLVVVERVLYE